MVNVYFSVNWVTKYVLNRIQTLSLISWCILSPEMSTAHCGPCVQNMLCTQGDTTQSLESFSMNIMEGQAHLVHAEIV